MVKGLKPEGVTVIIGAGAMGRMHVDLALSYRPGAVIVTDFIDERLERVITLFGARARQLNVALYAVNSARTELKDLINELTADHGADDVIVAVGSGKAIEMAQYYAGRGAVLNLFGGLKAGQEIVKVDSSLIHYKEINVTGSSGGSPWDVARTLSLMATSDIAPAAHITRIGDLGHAIEFLKMVQNQKIDGKAVVYPHRRTTEISVVDSWMADDERHYLAKKDVAL
jgi:L-iditol 2-dehydrogenase